MPSSLSLDPKRAASSTFTATLNFKAPSFSTVSVKWNLPVVDMPAFFALPAMSSTFW